MNNLLIIPVSIATLFVALWLAVGWHNLPQWCETQQVDGIACLINAK